jgi:hypothetical protein
MFKILLSFCIIIQSFNSLSQTFWKIKIEEEDEILLTIDINTENKTFEAYTRKDALKDLAGTFIFTLAKAAGRLKYAEIVFMEGKVQSKGDSLVLVGKFNYFDKQYPFTASISGMSFKGQYLDSRGRSHQLTGIKVADGKPIKDYASIINHAFSITEKTLLNPLWLKSDEWVDFRKKVNILMPGISDDYELAATFYWLGKKLPFSPYEIGKTGHNRQAGRKIEVTEMETKSGGAALYLNTLPVTIKAMDSIVTIINRNRYSNLIIDLRGRNRIYPDAANELLNYLSDKTFYAGAFLTRKWFETNTYIPTTGDFEKKLKSDPETGNNIGELYNGPARFLNIVPTGKNFKGKAFILTDSRTSRVSEALVYIIKKSGIATIVGQKTAGALILSENIRINNEYDLNLPVSDFYTDDGKNLNKNGIYPDIQLSGEDALKYVLKML